MSFEKLRDNSIQDMYPGQQTPRNSLTSGALLHLKPLPFLMHSIPRPPPNPDLRPPVISAALLLIREHLLFKAGE